MNVQLLSKIAEFERYVCTVWTPNNVSMKFYVRYNDNSKGYVYGYHFIDGMVPSIFDLVKLHFKIRSAKDLIEKDEWHYVWEKYGIKREEFLIPRTERN